MPLDAQCDTGRCAAFPVSLVLEYRGADTGPWNGGGWQVVVALPGRHGPSRVRRIVPLHKDAASCRLLCSGYEVTLHRDDAESYYCNLMGVRPSLFVVCREGGEERPEPELVTASYGEAASYSETEENVYAVTMPPEIYLWIEAYVLEHYVPEKRRKRKRDDWKKQEPRT